MLNNLGLNGKNPLIYHIYTKDSPSVTDEDIAIVGKAIVGESKVSDEQVAFEAGMKQVRSMYFNGKLVYNYRPCEKIELNARELVLTNTVDNSFKLSVKVTPSNCTEGVTFTSSNTNVATVNIDGTIHPVNLGTCNIIATCDKKSVTCKVHVKEQTLYLYNRGVVNNSSEFGQIVHPSDTSKFSYATDNIFLTLAGSTSNYGTIWFSWANRVDFGEYDVMHMDITNTADHSTIIGLTRNNKTGQQGYQNGNPTAVDGTTFVEDRTVIALKQGVNKHSLDVDLVNGVGYLGLYFKRNTDTGDTLEGFININTIYLIRKSVYVLGTDVDTSEEVNVPCTGLSFTQDEIDLEYTGNTMYNLNTLLSIDPQNCDERVQWTVIDDGDHVMDVNDTGYLSITGLGSAHVQAICGKYFDSIRVNTISSCTGISLNKSNLSFTSLNATQTLIATLTPSNTTDTVTWSSNNNNVATVSNGVVTAKGNGTCTITATCGSKSATCSVTVNNISITANQEYLSINTNIGEYKLYMKEYFTFTNVSADNVTWTIEKTSGDIGTLNSSGVLEIAFQTVATAKVTATHNGVSASIIVQAVRAAIVCTGLTLNNSSLNFTGTEVTQTLVATPTPSNTTDSITWKSSNTNIATVDNNGVVTSKANGSCTITATCGDKSATCNVVVSVACRELTFDIDSLTVGVEAGTYDVAQYLNVVPISCQLPVTWSINKTSVATINSSTGVLTPKAVGTATITATCGDKSATLPVTIRGVELELSAYESYMSPGELHTFYAYLRNGDIYQLEVRSSKPDTLTFTYTVQDSTTMAISVKMDANNPEAGAINFYYDSNLIEAFTVYVRI